VKTAACADCGSLLLDPGEAVTGDEEGAHGRKAQPPCTLDKSYLPHSRLLAAESGGGTAVAAEPLVPAWAAALHPGRRGRSLTHTHARLYTRLLRAPRRISGRCLALMLCARAARPDAAAAAYRRFKAASPLRGLHAVFPRHSPHAERLDTSVCTVRSSSRPSQGLPATLCAVRPRLQKIRATRGIQPPEIPWLLLVRAPAAGAAGAVCALQTLVHGWGHAVYCVQLPTANCQRFQSAALGRLTVRHPVQSGSVDGRQKGLAASSSFARLMGAVVLAVRTCRGVMEARGSIARDIVPHARPSARDVPWTLSVHVMFRDALSARDAPSAKRILPNRDSSKRCRTAHEGPSDAHHA
jgi:hypothetical protein